MSDHIMHDGSYEQLREAVRRLPPAEGDDVRDLVWADRERLVAVARDAQGRLELFVVGDPLTPANPLVAEQLQHQTWTTSERTTLEANRIVLPDAAHFDGMAAFICAELLRNGVGADRDRAFAATEPVIALALRRQALGDQVLVGLAGELYTLRSLLSGAAEGARGHLLDCWFGSQQSSRDFQLGTIGLEVKTTAGPASDHHVQGVYQLEKGLSVGGTPESNVHLLSLGVEWLPTSSDDGGVSIASMVEEIALASPDSLHRDRFLTAVRQYGADASVGYDHLEHRSMARYQRRFALRFCRLYDMSDERIRVLRAANLDGLVHVDSQSVAFRVRLPSRVRGDINPVAGMPRAVSQILKEAGIPRR